MKTHFRIDTLGVWIVGTGIAIGSMLILASMAQSGTPCAESPSGQDNCDKFVARDANPAALNGLIIYPNAGATPGPACADSANSSLYDNDNTSAVQLEACSRGMNITGQTDVVRLSIQAAPTQTSNLTSWRNASKTPMSVMGATGNLGLGTGTASTRLTIQGPADVTNIGGTTTANAATAIVGSGTTFLTSLAVGDRISLSSAATTYATVTAITDDTHLTASRTLGNGSSQTINKQSALMSAANPSATPVAWVDGLGHPTFDGIVVSHGGALTSPYSSLAIGDNTTMPRYVGSTDYNYSNIAIGRGALGALVSGSFNIAIGLESQDANSITGESGHNISLGYRALNKFGAMQKNTAVGSYACSGGDSYTNSSNVCIGYSAGNGVTTGSGNIWLGPFAGSGYITSGSNNILIGNDVRAASATASGQLNIGNTIYATGMTTGTTASAGKVGINTNAPAAALTIKDGHHNFAQTTIPDVASGGCTTNTITTKSTDAVGEITLGGTCTTVKSVVININKVSAWTNAPMCVAGMSAGATIQAVSASASTTQLTLAVPADVTTGDKIVWHCIGVE